MSILRDLDPTNARLSAVPTPRSGRATVWIIALLLIVAGTAWLFLAQHRERKNGTIESQQIESAHSVNPPSALELVQRPPAAPLLPPEQSHSSKPDKGAALIRESTDPRENALESRKAPLDIHQELNSGLKAVPSDKEEAAVAPQKKSRQNRPSNSAATKKQGKTLVAHTAADGSRLLTTTKKSAERDIDIITAIVR